MRQVGKQGAVVIFKVWPVPQAGGRPGGRAAPRPCSTELGPVGPACQGLGGHGVDGAIPAVIPARMPAYVPVVACSAIPLRPRPSPPAVRIGAHHTLIRARTDTRAGRHVCVPGLDAGVHPLRLHPRGLCRQGRGAPAPCHQATCPMACSCVSESFLAVPSYYMPPRRAPSLHADYMPVDAFPRPRCLRVLAAVSVSCPCPNLPSSRHARLPRRRPLRCNAPPPTHTHHEAREKSGTGSKRPPPQLMNELPHARHLSGSCCVPPLLLHASRTTRSWRPWRPPWASRTRPGPQPRPPPPRHPPRSRSSLLPQPTPTMPAHTGLAPFSCCDSQPAQQSSWPADATGCSWWLAGAAAVTAQLLCPRGYRSAGASRVL